jgi:MoaA/NifB/PqqE/SkfB family radical SAM enzyme
MRLKRALTEQLPRLVGFRLAYEGLIKPPAPINLTLSITMACNSRCQSCDIWTIYPAEKENLANELTLPEIERVFASIGPIYFFNISGGEPFLRKDIVDIVRLACVHLRPKVVHIPTNALMPARIASLTEAILKGMREWGPEGVKLTLKPSFDGVGEFHDWVRGIPGNYAKLVDTVGRLKALQAEYPNLGVGLGTVISAMNIDHLPEIIEQAARFAPDTYISEVAEERAEMRNANHGITPTAARYRQAIRRFQDDTFERLKEASGLELLTQAIRHVYYDITARWLAERRQVIPCYAGISNAHLSPYGEVWPCAILADGRSFGNLKDNGYDFWRVWHSRRADEVRSGIKAGQCDCPLANQAYANVLLSPTAMAEVGRLIVKAKVARLAARQSAAPNGPPADAPVPEAALAT